MSSTTPAPQAERTPSPQTTNSTPSPATSRMSSMAVQLRGKSFSEQEAALSPVQRDRPSGQSTGDIQAAAQQGVASGGGALPHLGAIQRSFGRHDVTAVQAHTDGAAREATDAIGANAYASGNHVALGGGGTDLHTVAHEAAHIVQQRAGVQLSGGVGQSGDPYERHADAVADAVVQGKSAEGLLDTMAGGSQSGKADDGPVQRSAKLTHMGTFTDERYEFEGTTKQHIVVKFTPGDAVDATRIGLVQTIKDQKEGVANSIDPTARSRKSDDGHAIDRLSDKDTPVYGSPSLGADGGLENTPKDNNDGANPTQVGSNATFQTGSRTKNGENWDVEDAGLSDSPTIVGGPLTSKEFETAALALDGPQKGTYYGSIKWGFKKGAEGALTAVPFDIASMGVPSKEFMGAAAKWNGSKVRGSMRVKSDGTDVLNGAGAKTGTIDKTVILTMVAPVAMGDVYHLKCKLPDNNIVYLRTDLVEDAGDGAAMKQLPNIQVNLTTSATEVYDDGGVGGGGDGSGSVLDLKSKFEKKEAKLLKVIPKGTRTKIDAVRGDKSLIEVVDGAHTGLKGLVTSTQLTPE